MDGALGTPVLAPLPADPDATPRRRFDAELQALFGRIQDAKTFTVRGRVAEVTGLLVRAQVPGVRLGEVCRIQTPLDGRTIPAEVVGFRDRQTYLMGLDRLEGVGPDSVVSATGEPLTAPAGDALLGRVLDGLGRPIDGRGPLRADDAKAYPVDAPPPPPLGRQRIDRIVSTGVRSIDAFLTLGRGQRVGIFAGAGQGKSTLLGMLARNASADINVIALIGERGREVQEFLEESLGEEGMARSVVIAATSDQPSLVRLKAAFVATAIAESFRDAGHHVLLMMDSVTRFARAQREVGLAIGEPPARGGFPPSVFAVLPRLLERTGNSARGAITAVYTVLVEGEDFQEPVADEVRSILDGHIVLSSDLAARGHFPAVDVLRSASRLFLQLATDEHARSAQQLRAQLAAYEENRDLILIGAYQKGSDPAVDQAIAQQDAVDDFLRQGVHESTALDDSLQRLAALARTD
ncbi:MAG: FliI/YscN family ATPase [Acidobacteriota bacterium]